MALYMILIIMFVEREITYVEIKNKEHQHCFV